MPNLKSKEVYESNSVDGASFVLYRVTEPRRAAFRTTLVVLQEKIRVAVEEQEAIDKLAKESQDRNRWNELEEQIHVVSDQMNATWVKWGLHSIDLTIDDVPVTPDNFVELAPKALFDEVHAKIRERTALGGAEIKNSKSPSTSSDPVDSTATPTTA